MFDPSIIPSIDESLNGLMAERIEVGELNAELFCVPFADANDLTSDADVQLCGGEVDYHLNVLRVRHFRIIGSEAYTAAADVQCRGRYQIAFVSKGHWQIDQKSLMSSLLLHISPLVSATL